MIENTPDGVVVFFPSYVYLSRVVSVWKKPSRHVRSGQTLWDRVNTTKPVFLEPRSANVSEPDFSRLHNLNRSSRSQHGESESGHESILTSYASAIATNSGKGALLLSVIGGSLSEGINFSDALGRAVVVVGLPFPNPHSAEWKAKATYVEAKAASRSTSAGSPGVNGESVNKREVDPKVASRDFYENVCMRAVNQCIGRAIRHKNDYAAIVLLDKRYGLPRIQTKLPGWIKESLREPGNVGTTAERLRAFFAEKQLMSV